MKQNDNLKLTIDQLKNYLGTGLKCKVKHKTISSMKVKNPMFTLDLINVSFTRAQFWTYDPIFCDQFGFTGKGFQKNEFNPICYRLSDLDKFIPELGFVPIENLYQSGWSQHQITLLNQKAYTHVSFNLIQILFQWHFWPFGEEYFEQGLVIDKLNFKREEK